MSGAIIGVTGATGHIGGLLLRRLLADPAIAEVRSVARRPLQPGPWGASFLGDIGGSASGQARLVHVCSDLRGADARKAVEGCDLLFHLGAQVWREPGAGGLAGMASVNIDGTLNLVGSSRAPRAVVFASSAAVYGAWPDNPLPLPETHEVHPNYECPYAQHKLLAERICATGTARWAVARLSAVLGAHADARVARAVRGYRLAVPAIAGARQAVQWLDEDDAVAGLLATGRDLLGPGKTAGQVVNLATSDWLSAADVARLARSRVVALPRRVLLAAAETGRGLRLSPFGADRAVLLSGPLALSPEKAARLLGWEPSASSEQVMAAALLRDWHGAPMNRRP